TIDHSRCQFCLMNGRTTSSTKSRQLCRIIRCSSDRPRSAAVRSSIGSILSYASMDRRELSGLPVREKLAHAIERLQDVFRRVRIAHADVALAQNAEIGPANNGNARIFEERRGKSLGFPAGPLDVGKRIERALWRCA